MKPFLCDIIIPSGHRRTGHRPFGGAGRVLPEWIQWGGGSSSYFLGSIFCGVAEFFPLTAVTDPKFLFFFRLLQ